MSKDIIKLFEQHGWIYDYMWQPWWKEFLFGKRKVFFGPVGTPYVVEQMPKNKFEALQIISHHKEQQRKRFWGKQN